MAEYAYNERQEMVRPTRGAPRSRERILQDWRWSARRPNTYRDDVQSRADVSDPVSHQWAEWVKMQDGPEDFYTGSILGPLHSTTYQQANYDEHERQFFGIIGCLNRGQLSGSRLRRDRTRIMGDPDASVPFNPYRKEYDPVTKKYVPNAIPYRQQSLFHRPVDRDASEDFEDVEYEVPGRGYDMKPLRDRVGRRLLNCADKK